MKKTGTIKHMLLTVCALFLVGCPPYSVIILTPSDGEIFQAGVEITFTGSAMDLKDGELSGDLLVWNSDQEGELSKGKEFKKDDLVEGVHTITLTAKNSQGETTTDSITITISKGTPPTTTISVAIPSFEDLVIPDLPIPALDPSIEVADGWEASYLIPSNGITTPSNIFINAEGTLVVNQVKGFEISTITLSGEISRLAYFEGIPIFTFAFDGENAYVYNITSTYGSIYKVDKEGVVTTLVDESPVLPSGMSVITASQQGEVYLVVGTTLFKVSASGEIVTINESMESFQQLVFDSTGELFGVQNNRIYKINKSTGEASDLIYDGNQDEAVGMKYVPHCGLTVDTQGDFYTVDGFGKVYKITRSGEATILAEGFDDCFLQGVAVDEDGAVYVVSRRNNGVFRIFEGVIECVVVPNFLTTPQALALNSNKELYVCEDEAVSVCKYSSEGKFITLYNAVVMQAPLADIAIDQNDNVYVSEAEEGSSNPSQLVVLEVGATEKKVVVEMSDPSGLAFYNNELYVAEHGADRISIVTPEGEVTPYVTNIDRPQFMDFDTAGNLYVVTGGLQSIDKVDSAKVVTRVYSGSNLGGIKITEEGDILVGKQGFTPGEGMVLSITENVAETELISGLTSVVGFDVDQDGVIYLSDEILNVLIKLEKK